MNKQNRNNDKLQIRNSTAEFLTFAYQSKGDGIEVRVQDDTIWLSQKNMGLLFDTSIDNISLHIKNIYTEGELNEISTTEDYSVVQQEGSREVCRIVKHYNLDAIIAVGYRVNSKRATAFRQWATGILR
ncbi:MAG: virulence RhuM family protein, partial [Dysgonamonadaceae bacterium]|nr:virulence RhuM family protein [Dysgonamonadaceae bacterium]